MNDGWLRDDEESGVTYEFSPGRPLREELSRLFSDELDGAIAQLRGQREAERVKAVHAARKHLKKARSVLRLVRGPLGEKVYARENGRLRDAGLRLSDVRDAQVAVATLDALSDRFTGDLPTAAVNDVRGVLVSRRDAASEQAGGSADLVGEVVAKLTKSRDRLDRVRLDRGGWKALQGGLTLAYDRGRKAARRAERKPTLDRLHEWRKRAKDSWYHLRLLSPTWPAVLEPLSEQAHRLSELLGDDHDLGVLRATLAQDAGLFDGAAELDTLVGQVDRRRAELQREAFRLGRRFYAESTKVYTGRLAAYWDAWRDEAPPGRDETPQPGEQHAAPTVLAEPQLPRPALGSLERVPQASRPAAIREPQLAAPALGSIERTPFTPVPPPRPAAPVLPTPALGSHERPAAESTAAAAESRVAAAPAAAGSSAASSSAAVDGDEAGVGARRGASTPRRTRTRAAKAPARPRTPARKAREAASSTAQQVVATLTGRRYHRPHCALAGVSARPLTREEAVAAGLAPCASCRP